MPASPTGLSPAGAACDGEAPPRAFTRDFPGTASQVGEARRSLAALLRGCPATADAVLCLSELASNAVLHSLSGREGGHFTVRASVRAGCVRVEVEDAGGPWAAAGPGDLGGRGLVIVAGTARDWGVTGDGRRRVVWFELATGESE